MWDVINTENAIWFNDDGKRIEGKIRNQEHFMDVTGLGGSTYDRIKRNVTDYVPKLTTFLTLCMVYQLNMTMVRELRHSYGYDFNPKNKVHQAYIFLLVNCSGKSIPYCNRVLQALDIDKKDFLGDGYVDESITDEDVLK